MHQAPRPAGRGHPGPARRAGAGHLLPARPGQGRLGHRLHRPLAGLQRHLAGRRVGPSLGQPRRHPRRRRPPLAETPGQRRSAAEHAPGTGSDDHGPRDPGRDRPGELVQSRRPRPCAAGQGRVHRRLRQADGGRPRATAGRPLPRLRRRPGPAHLPSRTERRLAQVLGRWRRDEPRRAPGGHRLARRDGHSRRAQRAAVGFLRCPVQPHQQGPGDQARGQAALQLPPRATAAT